MPFAPFPLDHRPPHDFSDDRHHITLFVMLFLACLLSSLHSHDMQAMVTEPPWTEPQGHSPLHTQWPNVSYFQLGWIVNQVHFL